MKNGFGAFGKNVEDVSVRIKNAVAASIVGGAAAVVSGGKFVNGALTGAFSRLFNDLKPTGVPGVYRDDKTDKIWDYSGDLERATSEGDQTQQLIGRIMTTPGGEANYNSPEQTAAAVKGFSTVMMGASFVPGPVGYFGISGSIVLGLSTSDSVGMLSPLGSIVSYKMITSGSLMYGLSGVVLDAVSKAVSAFDYARTMLSYDGYK